MPGTLTARILTGNDAFANPRFTGAQPRNRAAQAGAPRERGS